MQIIDHKRMNMILAVFYHMRMVKRAVDVVEAMVDMVMDQRLLGLNDGLFHCH